MFDIYNSKPRKVVCIDNVDNGFGDGDDPACMEVGAIYTVVGVEIHSWHTLVKLDEFPGMQFNSVMFDEV